MLVNTAVAQAEHPALMAEAFRLAVEAGRKGFRAGRVPKRAHAAASSPTTGVVTGATRANGQAMSMSDAGEWLRASLDRRAGIALIIDHKRSALPLGEAVEQALTVGIELVQLRERDLTPRELLALAWELRRLTLARALFVINGDVELALAVAADGVHLPERGGSVAEARARMGRGCLVGRSVHSADAARAAQAEDADYVQVGNIFATQSHPDHAPAGLDLVREVRTAVMLPSGVRGTPLLAVGGITPRNARAVIEAGADGVAVIGAIMGSREPGRATRELRKTIGNGWRADPLSR